MFLVAARMQNNQGTDRNQLQVVSLEDTISKRILFDLSMLLQTVLTPLLYLARLEKTREEKEKWDSTGC